MLVDPPYYLSSLPPDEQLAHARELKSRWARVLRWVYNPTSRTHMRQEYRYWHRLHRQLRDQQRK